MCQRISLSRVGSRIRQLEWAGAVRAVGVGRISSRSWLDSTMSTMSGHGFGVARGGFGEVKTKALRSSVAGIRSGGMLQIHHHDYVLHGNVVDPEKHSHYRGRASVPIRRPSMPGVTGHAAGHFAGNAKSRIKAATKAVVPPGLRALFGGTASRADDMVKNFEEVDRGQVEEHLSAMDRALRHSDGNARDGINELVNDCHTAFVPDEDVEDKLTRLISDLDRLDKVQSVGVEEYEDVAERLDPEGTHLSMVELLHLADSDHATSEHFETVYDADAVARNPFSAAYEETAIAQRHKKEREKHDGELLRSFVGRLDAAENAFVKSAPMSLDEIMRKLDRLDPFDDSADGWKDRSTIHDTFKGEEDMKARELALKIAFGAAIKAAAHVHVGDHKNE